MAENQFKLIAEIWMSFLIGWRFQSLQPITPDDSVMKGDIGVGKWWRWTHVRLEQREWNSRRREEEEGIDVTGIYWEEVGRRVIHQPLIPQLALSPGKPNCRDMIAPSIFTTCESPISSQNPSSPSYDVVSSYSTISYT